MAACDRPALATARAVHSVVGRSAGVARFSWIVRERGAMRHHRVIGQIPIVMGCALLLAACSGAAVEDPAVEPITAPATDDAQVAATGDGGEADSADAAAAGGDTASGGDAGADGSDATGDGAADAVGSDGVGDVEVDVTVIPEEITPEYVEAVLAELEQLYADALRELMLAGEPTREVTDRLGSAFSEPQYQVRLQELLAAVADDPTRFALPEQLEPRRHRGLNLIQAMEDCIYAETYLDASGILSVDQEPLHSFVILGPPDVERPNRRTGVAWVLYSLPVGDPDDLRKRNPCHN